MLPIVLTTCLALVAATPDLSALCSPQDPVRVVVFTGPDATEAGPDRQFAEGAQFVAAAWNDRGGVDGRPVEVVVETIADPKQAKDLVKGVIEGGAGAVLAPLDDALGAAVEKAAGRKFPCVRFDPSPENLTSAIDALSAEILVRQLVLLHDGSREAKSLLKMLEEDPEDGGLRPPTRLLGDLTLRTKVKNLARELGDAGAEALVIDGDPKKVAEFLQEVRASEDAGDALARPLVFTPRAWPAITATEGLEAYCLLGQCPTTLRGDTKMRFAFETAYQDMGYGAAEGIEAMELALRAIDAADGGAADAVAKALLGLTAECARAQVVVHPKLRTVQAPLTGWRFKDDRLQPAFPPELILASQQPTETGAPRVPDPTLGEPFATWRSRQFAMEPGTQWVLFTWGGGRGTIDRDLAVLGLSTNGAVPILDRLIRDELMSRVLAITNGKFGRTLEGASIPGKSLKISFATYEPDGIKPIAAPWPARFMGDDPSTGGRAFGSHCQIYSTFIRRTIFDEHKLEPPVGPDDLTYIDGSYTYGSDHLRDKRSELIRALINGFAGAMALTAAHEVGHLTGLGHITDDPKGIMNVEEGAGIDYRDAYFTPASWQHMVERLGLTPK